MAAFPHRAQPACNMPAHPASPLIVGQAALAAQIFTDQGFPALKILHPAAGDAAAARGYDLCGIHVLAVLLEAEIQMRAGGISGWRIIL